MGPAAPHEHRENAALSSNALLRRKAGAQPLDRLFSCRTDGIPSDSAGPEVCSASAACMALLQVT